MRTMVQAPPTECAVWWANLHDDPRLMQVLTPAEKRRAESLRRELDRQRFITGRALLRAILAERLGRPAPSFAIMTTCRVCGSVEHGRPELPGLGLSASISHTGERVGVALAPSQLSDDAELAIGIDVEATAGRTETETEALAKLVLTTAEYETWRMLPQDSRGAVAIEWWTRKESILKATGWGLAIAPDLVEVAGPRDHLSTARWTPEAARFLGDVPVAHLYQLDPGDGYVSSLASLNGAVTIGEEKGDRLLADAVA